MHFSEYSLCSISRKTNVGRSSLTFFSTSFSRENGGTAPDALPKETIMPLRLINLKLLSKLRGINDNNMNEIAFHARILPDTIENSINTFAVGQFQHSLHCILYRVQDDMIGSILLREFSLGWCRCGSNYGCTNSPTQLRQERS